MRAIHLVLISSLVVAACHGDSVTNVGQPNPPALPPPPTAPTPIPIGLTITGPTDVLVHQSALYAARVEFRIGDTTTIHDTTVSWTTSDATVARSEGGVLFAVARGSAVVTARFDSLETSVTVRVRARLRIRPEFDGIGPVDHILVSTPGSNGWSTISGWSMSQGDTVRLGADFVDVNGEPIDDLPVATWESPAPQMVSVNTTGLVSGQLPGSTVIKADSEDGADTFAIEVLSFVPGDTGGLATVRVAQASIGLGAASFTLSTGDGLSVPSGNSVALKVRPGSVVASIGGDIPLCPVCRTRLPIKADLKPGDDITVFLVGDDRGTYLTSTWSDHARVPSDSGRIRLVQGDALPVVYIRPTGAAPDGIAEYCYFDPGDSGNYYTAPAGSLDLLLTDKSFVPHGVQYPDGDVFRLPVAVPSGQSVTYVLTWDGQEARAIAFPDP